MHYALEIKLDAEGSFEGETEVDVTSELEQQMRELYEDWERAAIAKGFKVNLTAWEERLKWDGNEEHDQTSWNHRLPTVSAP